MLNKKFVGGKKKVFCANLRAVKTSGGNNGVKSNSFFAVVNG